MWTAGKRDTATVAFKQLVREIRDMATKTEPVTVKPGVIELAVHVDGTSAVAVVGGGAYWFDVAGTPIRYDAAPEASTAEFLPNSPLVVLGGFASQIEALVIVDSTTFGHVLEVGGGQSEVKYATSTSGKTLAYIEHPAGGPPRLHTWDVTTRRERKLYTLRDEDECSDLEVSADDKVISCMYDMGHGLALWFPDGARLDFPGPPEPRWPSYSNNGKWIAYGYPTFDDKLGMFGTTHLIDRATRKRRTTKAIAYPTATRFSKSGKLLIVGDLRELKILDVPSLRVRATTPRLPFGIDDQQDIREIEIIGNDLGFWAQTTDGSSGIFRLPSGTLVWGGHGDCTVSPSGVECMSDSPTEEAVSIDLKFHVTYRKRTSTDGELPPANPLLLKMSTSIDATVCTVSGAHDHPSYARVFPIAACR